MKDHSGPPDPIDLSYRLSLVETKLKLLERALARLFSSVNVNRVKDPDLDKVLAALAELQGGLERLRWHPPPRLRPERESPFVESIGLEFEEEGDVVTPAGRGKRLRVVATDQDGEQDLGTVDVPDEPRSR